MAALVLAAVGLGGCGGDDDRLSKADLISKGDALCAATTEKLEPVFGKLFPTGSETPPADKAAGPMRTAATELREEYRDFSALEPPAKDEKRFAAILEGFDAAVTDVEDAAERAEAGDTEGYLKKLEAANAKDAESRELMKAYGFEECAGSE
ncbi:MAG TPA: hypothetical protein VM030_04495 [Acidimicrobiales bacterium]|nr:hypothetical protein [Acidimicrobiales bacterium]